MSMPADRDRAARLRVGILGAGPVTQAIHLPTLARLSDDFEVRVVMDVHAPTAETVARRAGATYTTRAEDVFGDPSVDVIVICSPSHFHAAQVIAACRAGVKAILCEKPFAMTAAEANEIAAVSEETGVPIIVGAMHTFDPAWLAAQAEWGALVETSHTIRSSVVIPPNAQFEDLSTDIVGRASSAPVEETGPDAAVRAVTGGIMGLAIHDLPLIRQFLPTFADLDVLRAELAPPWGYVISGTASGKVVHLQATTTESWAPEWTLEIIGDDLSLHVTFTPSYVQGGSAVATLHSSTGSRTFGPFAVSGYDAEWMALARIARGQDTPPPTVELIDDLRFAIALADQSSSHIRSNWKSAA
ncbi:Gfo/Idh/MocA family oxidoreductase [Microbacterium sp. CFBP9034]|uniref:Gfo/Idh/MocA family protein n=1 Tax=Microbacterium sp. CFBP9034 TaxID=3096540 RepID=UPI002A6A3B7A|nr:Gfo/Idh/MocA family oxidoreductase [Microbacterium sp. CFBP9034]MDY0908481.1 Gfo/Idh/MocA family oxidoreductase [Microbacterium sp. CFBP9034]